MQATELVREEKRTTQAPEEGRPQENIAVLAYQLWIERGCPIGSPEDDWYEAERQLSTQAKVRSKSA